MSAFEKKKKKITQGKKWHSPFCFREDKLDVVLCVKASKFMHTREHTHSFFFNPQKDSQSFLGPVSEGALKCGV